MNTGSRPVAIDLFAGAGGMSLGFEQAGFDVRAAVEIDPIHACIHKFNFPECTVIPKSVCDVSADEIRKSAKLGNEKVSVVCGGAPCQGFSMIGQRILDDPRNSLVNEFVRLVCELDADHFVFENVKGLTVGKHKKFLTELIETFESKGYEVQRHWQVLNAVNYGTPQDRKRLFLLGSKKGLPVPIYPEPSTRHPQAAKDCFLKKAPTCSDALADLPDADEFSQLWDIDEVRLSESSKLSAYAKEMRCLSPAHWHFGHRRQWNPDLLTSSIRTKHTDISRTRFAETLPGTVEPISRFFKLAPDGVSNTLRAGTDAARGAFTSPRPIHFEYPRCITIREMARLHGFPDWFRLHRTKWHGARQIGNSVPPPLARAVASSIMEALSHTPRPSKQSLPLGDTSLLDMDMSRAAAYWQVPAPPSKRDRKSGATKRSQIETERARLAAKSSIQHAS